MILIGIGWFAMFLAQSLAAEAGVRRTAESVVLAIVLGVGLNLGGLAAIAFGFWDQRIDDLTVPVLATAGRAMLAGSVLAFVRRKARAR